MVASLPQGCVSAGQVFQCGNVYYKPYMSGNQIVYGVVRREKSAYPGDPTEAKQHLEPERLVPSDATGPMMAPALMVVKYPVPRGLVIVPTSLPGAYRFPVKVTSPSVSTLNRLDAPLSLIW